MNESENVDLYSEDIVELEFGLSLGHAIKKKKAKPTTEETAKAAMRPRP